MTIAHASLHPSHHDIELAAAALVQLPAPVLLISLQGVIFFANRSASRKWTPFSTTHAKLDPNLVDQHISTVGRFRSLETDTLEQSWERICADTVVGGKLPDESKDTEPGVLRWFETIRDNVITGWLEVTVSSLDIGESKYISLFFHTNEHRVRSALNNKAELHSRPDTCSHYTLIRQLQAAVFDSVATIGFIVSADGSTVVFNRAAKEFIGAEAVKAISNDGIKFLHHFPAWNADFTRLLEPFERPGVRLITSRKNQKEETMGFLNSTTNMRYVMSINGECLYDPDSRDFVGGIFRIKSALTLEDYQAQRLASTIESFETIANFIPQIAWRADPAGNVDYFSERWTQYTGLSVEESVGFGFMKAVHEDDKNFLMDSWRNTMAGGSECSAEIRYRARDATYRWMLVRASPLKDDDGNILSWYGTHTDIDSLVKSRQRNRKKWDQVLQVLSNAEVQLFALNKEGTVTLSVGAMANPHYQNSEEVVGLNVFAIKPGTTGAENIVGFQRNVRDILDGKQKTSTLEYSFGPRRYKTRLTADYTAIDTNHAVESNDEIQGVLGLTIDMTDVQERSRLEIENARLSLEEQTAQNSSKMKSQFLANMSHEMRTPLAGIIGLVDLLLETEGLGDEQLDYVRNIRLSSRMLLAIVNDVLDFSKVENGRLDIEEVAFDLSLSLKDLYQLLSSSAQQKDIELVVDADIDCGLLLGDPGRIRQVLLNLLTNSIKFTQVGSITLTVTLHEENDTSHVRFVVEDTGIGIKKETLEQLFQPFRQGDSSTARLYGGTGLGLAISKNLAHLMHGTLELESTQGVGSKATFTVPLKRVRQEDDSITAERSFQRRNSKPLIEVLTAQTASKLPPPLARHAHSAPAGIPQVDIRISEPHDHDILVVEDNAINSTIAVKTIRKLGYTTKAVWNGQEALDYLASCISSSDSLKSPRLPLAVLMDCQMPVLDGYNATRAIRTEAPFRDHEALQKVPIIALTASAIQGDQEKCIDAGMNDYLAKPVGKKVLEGMLRKWGVREGSGSGGDAGGIDNTLARVGTF